MNTGTSKEDFCLACAAAIPLAFSATAVSTIDDNNNEEENNGGLRSMRFPLQNSRRKNKKFWKQLYIGIIILSICIIIYYKFIANCESCR